MNPDYEKIDKLLVAKPFSPFVIKCGKSEFTIKRRREARFNRHGTLEVRQGSTVHCLNDIHVTLL
jgi:hypothetical protein